MIIHHVRVMTKPGLQAGARHLPFPIASCFQDTVVDIESLVPWAQRVVPRAAWLVCASAMVITSSLMSAQAVSGAVRYRVTSMSVLSLDRALDVPLVDTVQTTSLLDIATSSGVDTIATLMVDSLQQTSTGMVRRTADAFSRGISVSAVLQNGRPRITGDSASACVAERPLAGLLPELLPMLPTPLRAEQQWSDTLTVTTCRSGLPVTTVTIVNSRTLTGMDTSTVLLERRALIRASGSATIRAQTVTLTGVGTSESLGVVLIASRRLQSLRGTQSLEFQITNGQQTRQMVQQITDTATLLP